MTKEKEIEYDIEKDKEFDPIKKQIGGKAAEQVIWSTYSLNAAVNALKQGLPLKANPFIGKNTKLLKADLVYKRTSEEIDDYIKCKQDPVYFASKCYLMTPEGLQPCKLRDYQVDYLRHLQKHRFSIFLSCRQSGKSTTTAIYCLWVILFNTDKSGLILSKSGPAGVDLIKKIKDMYMYLPYHLKCGTLKWNQSEISFDNNSSISTEAFSPTAGLGKTINFLILDEFAWCPPNDVELFYNNIIPTVTTISDSNVCIMSTQNGFNLFYKLWKAAIEGRSMYGPFKVDWDQVPQFNPQTKQWEKRTEAWKEEMIGILGSEEAFYYQYGTMFSASDKCLVSRSCLSNFRDNAKLWTTRNEDLMNCGINLTLQYSQYLFWRPDFDLNELKTGFFLVIIDLAEGFNGDYTVFNIFQMKEKDKFIHVGRWYSNEVDLEHAALEFWLLAGQLFNNENCLFSLEWNTYGALFYQIVLNLNEDDYDVNNIWRFNVINSYERELEITNFIMYKKQSIDQQVLNKQSNSSNYIPGIKFTSGNKGPSCALLKHMFEKNQIDTNDLITIGELENFEDKNGNGSYAASYGHDDSIMTFVQLPLIAQSARYKNLLEDILVYSVNESQNTKWGYTDKENDFDLNNIYNNDSNYMNYLG